MEKGSAKLIKTKKDPKGHSGKGTQCPQLLKLIPETPSGFTFAQRSLVLPGSLVLRHRILRVLS